MKYMLLGVVLVGAGFMAGGHIFRPKGITSSRNPLLPYSHKETVVVFGISLFISTILVYMFQLGVYVPGRVKSLGGTVIGFSTFFLNDTVMLFILLCICAQSWRFIRLKHKLLTIVMVAFCVIQGFAGGSRGGFVRIALWLIFVLLAFTGDFRVGKKLPVFLVFGIVISFLVFPYVTDLKGSWHGELIKDTSTFSTALGESLGAGWSIYSLLAFYSSINRLNGLAPVTAILSFPERHFREYMDMSNVVKLVINKLLPGVTPFPETIASARMFNVVIHNYSLYQVINNYQSNTYSLWGISYAHFGWWGGLLAIFSMALAIGAGYQLLGRIRSRLRLLYKAWMLIFVYSWLKNFGFDSLICGQFIFIATIVFFHWLMARLGYLGGPGRLRHEQLSVHPS